ncbi:MAG: hypothetical protein M1833_007019 [Piccolia ochrophora]|nr:MAG: hypothetical protein M1833_007019 [Piccolia ochrophora]
MAQPDLRQKQLLEQVWQVTVSNLTQGVSEVVLPFHYKDTIGQDGIDTIVQRYSALIGGSCVVFLDKNINAIRLAPPQAARTPMSISSSVPSTPSTQSVSSPVGEDLTFSPTVGSLGEISSKKNRIPRPPNAFILYRKHHHPLLKENDPSMHNNEISVILGRQWKNETPETKAHFKSLAEQVKQEHTKAHPEYQYQPRKPSEKKRRMTVKKAAVISQASELSALPNTSGIVAAEALDQSPGKYYKELDYVNASMTKGETTPASTSSDSVDLVGPSGQEHSASATPSLAVSRTVSSTAQTTSVNSVTESVTPQTSTGHLASISDSAASNSVTSIQDPSLKNMTGAGASQTSMGPVASATNTQASGFAVSVQSGSPTVPVGQYITSEVGLCLPPERPSEWNAHLDGTFSLDLPNSESHLRALLSEFNHNYAQPDPNLPDDQQFGMPDSAYFTESAEMDQQFAYENVDWNTAEQEIEVTEATMQGWYDNNKFQDYFDFFSNA